MRSYLNSFSCPPQSREHASALCRDFWIPRSALPSRAPCPLLLLLLLPALPPPHKVSSTSLRIQSKSQNAEGAWEAGVWSCVPAIALLSLRVLGFPGTLRCLLTSVAEGLNQSGRNRWYWGNELPALYSPAPGLLPSSLAGKKRPVITNLRSTNHPQWLLALGDLQAQSSFSYLT